MCWMNCEEKKKKHVFSDYKGDFLILVRNENKFWNVEVRALLGKSCFPITCNKIND